MNNRSRKGTTSAGLRHEQDRLEAVLNCSRLLGAGQFVARLAVSPPSRSGRQGSCSGHDLGSFLWWVGLTPRGLIDGSALD